MQGPPGSFMQAWQGKGYGWGTSSLPPGPLAYATGSLGQPSGRPDVSSSSSPMQTTGLPTTPPSFAPPLLRTAAPVSSASANADAFAAPAASSSTGPSMNIAGSLAGTLGGGTQSAGDAASRTGISSAFEMLGKRAPAESSGARMETSDAIMKALTMAVSGERKSMPSWSGNVSTLRAWLRQLSFWEIDNHTPKQRWGIKLFQAFGENTVPRRIAEGVPMDVVLSERGYGAILTAVLGKFKPYLEAAGPAAIDLFFYSGERQRNESFSSFIAAKELAKQEVENLTGEIIPPKLAGRVLLKQANLSEQQRETIAIRFNALLSFEEVAVALRPLDRPDALLKPMTSTSLAATTLGGSTYWGSQDPAPEPVPDGHKDQVPDDPPGNEWDDYGDEEDDHQPYYDEAGEPLLYFEADREYDEDEAIYIWAFADAYNQLAQDWEAEMPASAYPAYQDVRKELQDRRKGRQFFRPEGKGRGRPKGSKVPGGPKAKGKGRGRARGKGRGPSKGTAEDLLSRTRCYSCGELGHFSRDCPHPASSPSNPSPNRTSFVLSLGPTGGATNRTYMTSENGRHLAIYAGVRTGAGEGLVDSAAEDAVIGSGAFQRLKALLAQQGLQPQAVRSSSTGACAGIGGNARVANVWDIPVGVVKTNGLLRVTEVEDTDGFETPFLIPVSFQELVGMVIDYDAAEVRTRQGKATSMHRLPSGHRSVSVVEFDGKWTLPKELMVHNRDPFQLPRVLKPQPRAAPAHQQRGVAVWLRHPNGCFEQMAWLEGPRKRLVVPEECLPSEITHSLDTSRVTYLDGAPDTGPYIINDVWCHSLGSRELEDPWTGAVIFQQANQAPTATSTSTSVSSSTTPTLVPTTSASSAGQVTPNATAAVQVGPSVYPMADASEPVADSSAAHDFEGVFLSPSVLGGGSQNQSPWAALRSKSDRLFRQLAYHAQQVPRRTGFFVAWAREHLRPAVTHSIYHAAANPLSCARRSRTATGESSAAPARSSMVRTELGAPGGDHDADDRYCAPAAGGGRPSVGRFRCFEHGFFFYGSSQGKEQSQEEDARSSAPGSRATTFAESGPNQVDPGAGTMPACRTGLENEGKSGTLLVGMLEMRKPLGESGSSNGGGDRATSEAHAAGLPINPAAKHASSSQVTAQPEQFDFRAGKEPADTDDGSHYLIDYPIREGHAKHEAGGGLREAAQGGGCAGVPGGCVPCGAQLPVRPTGKEPGTYVRFDERRGGLGNLGSLSKNAGSC